MCKKTENASELQNCKWIQLFCTTFFRAPKIFSAIYILIGKSCCWWTTHCRFLRFATGNCFASTEFLFAFMARIGRCIWTLFIRGITGIFNVLPFFFARNYGRAELEFLFNTLCGELCGSLRLDLQKFMYGNGKVSSF